MFRNVRLRGSRASILWGYRPAAELTAWTIVRVAKPKNGWQLRGTMTRPDRFMLRQTPLLFTAPRDGGFWLWPIETLNIVNERSIVAALGQPEQ